MVSAKSVAEVTLQTVEKTKSRERIYKLLKAACHVTNKEAATGEKQVLRK